MHDLWFGELLSPEAEGRDRLMRQVGPADRPATVLSSHFAYEEEELVEPIGRPGVRM